MNRRDLLRSIGGAVFCISAPTFSQTPPAVRRIGFLSSESPSNQGKRLEALRAGLRDLGYTEGKDIVIEVRWAEGNYGRLPALAAELSRLHVSVVVTSGTKATLAMRGANTPIPIVMGSTGDPIGLGLAANLARPGGTVTGSSNLGSELAGKRLELLKEAMPRLERAAYIVNPADPTPAFATLKSASAALKVELRLVEVAAAKDFERSIVDLARQRFEAIVLQGDTLFQVNAPALADLTKKHRLPSAGILEYAEAGGMIGYGADPLEGHRRAAVYVDKILKGAQPGELPIEGAMRFQLKLNLKTARMLGIEMPQSLMLRAAEVIQ